MNTGPSPQSPEIKLAKARQDLEKRVHHHGTRQQSALRGRIMAKKNENCPRVGNPCENIVVVAQLLTDPESHRTWRRALRAYTGPKKSGDSEKRDLCHLFLQ